MRTSFGGSLFSIQMSPDWPEKPFVVFLRKKGENKTTLFNNCTFLMLRLF